MRGLQGLTAAWLLFFSATAGAGAGLAPNVWRLRFSHWRERFRTTATSGDMLPSRHRSWPRAISRPRLNMSLTTIQIRCLGRTSNGPRGPACSIERRSWPTRGGSPVERLGGLLAVAAYALDKNDKARATRIVEAVERELPSIKADDSDEAAALLPDLAAEIWARLEQTERAARLLEKGGVGSVSTLLSIAGEYPAAASLREQALPMSHGSGSFCSTMR